MNIKTKNRVGIGKCFILLSLLISILLSCGISINTVHAEEIEEPLTIESSINHTMFITFCKRENSTVGKALFACHYMPNEYYSDSYTYGVLIFPKRYMEKFNVYDDFNRKFEEQGVSILDVVGSGHYDVAEGKMFRCGIGNINPQNLSLTFTFVFYGKDNATGEIYYTEPQFATYDTSIAKDYSVVDVTVMINNKLQMNLSFSTIVSLLNELLDSIWKYLILAAVAIVGVWGAYIGLRIVIAKKKEEILDSRGMVKNLIIGILIIFTVAVVGPLLLKGLNAWVGININW